MRNIQAIVSSCFHEPVATGKYYSFIDGLRAIAVLGVLVYHLDDEMLPGGYLGVDVFFVISGFLIQKNSDRTATFPWFRL